MKMIDIDTNIDFLNIYDDNERKYKLCKSDEEYIIKIKCRDYNLYRDVIDVLVNNFGEKLIK